MRASLLGTFMFLLCGPTQETLKRFLPFCHGNHAYFAGARLCRTSEETFYLCMLAGKAELT